MKTNITRLISITLAVLMVVCSFSACKKKPKDNGDTSTLSTVEVSVDPGSTNYFTIDENSERVVLKENDDGTTVIEVAEGTTLEQFNTDVVATEGYALKMFNADGTEVTDAATVLATGMQLKVFLLASEEGAEDTEVETYDINVVSAAEIEQQKAANKDPNRVNTNGGNGGGNGGATANSLKGYSFVLGSHQAGKYTENSTIGNVYKSQIETIKSKYNCSVEFKTYSDDAGAVVNEVMAGNCQADILELSLAALRSVAKQGCAVDLSSYSLGKAYTNGFTESCTYSGKKYAVAFPAMGATPMGVIYNKDLIKQYNGGKDVVASAYKSKEWTFDKFREVAKKCTSEADGIFGVTSNTNIIGMAITSEAGGTATRNSSGKIVATMCNQNGIKALEFMKELYWTDKSYKYNADISTSVNDFIAGKAAMFASNMDYYSTMAASATFELGFVLMPMGPDQSSYITGAYDGNGFLVPKNKESTAGISVTFLNQLANANGKIINAKSEEMQRNGLDKNAVSAYKYAVNNATAEYRTGAIDSTVSAKVDTSVLSKGTDPSTVVAEVQGQLQSQLDEFYSGNLA